jgi:hypothetical protein
MLVRGQAGAPKRKLLLTQYCIVAYCVADLRNFGMDPDPALFVSDLQDVNKKIIIF